MLLYSVIQIVLPQSYVGMDRCDVWMDDWGAVLTAACQTASHLLGGCCKGRFDVLARWWKLP